MGKYDDIINMPHHVSANRPHMSNYDRAAQFSPFAALTGFEDAIDETARLTDRKPEPSDEEIEKINAQLNYVAAHRNAVFSVTYFVPDKNKSGGKYLTKTGTAKVERYKQRLECADGTKIAFDDVLCITIPDKSNN